VLCEVYGEAADDRLGSSVARTADLDGDGKNDFIAGAPRANPNGQPNAGSAYVFSSAACSLIFRVNGAVREDFLGRSVAGIGDFDGDGNADFVVGAPFADPDTMDRSVNSGAAFVYSGLDGSVLLTIRGDSADDYLGQSVADAGDVNGDGRADFIVGAPNANPEGRPDAGWAGIFLGPGGFPVYELTGDSTGDLFGWSVAGAGDVDGDGSDDVIVGAIGADPNGFDYAGSAFLLSGADRSVIFRAEGSGSLHELGYVVGGAGDVNGDGRPDILASALLADSGRGEVFVYGLVATGAADEKNVRPIRFELSQNYPNPFNAATTIRYVLPKGGNVTLEVFNLAGQRVKILAEESRAAGEHTVAWNGKDEKGRALPSGVYFYRISGKDFSETKKMILLK
jgi:hypothetical protein